MLRLGMNNLTTLLGYGKEWQKHRKAFQEGLRKNLMPGYAQLQTEKLKHSPQGSTPLPRRICGSYKMVCCSGPSFFKREEPGLRVG